MSLSCSLILRSPLISSNFLSHDILMSSPLERVFHLLALVIPSSIAARRIKNIHMAIISLREYPKISKNGRGLM